jgi:hypothetical protein
MLPARAPTYLLYQVDAATASADPAEEKAASSEFGVDFAAAIATFGPPDETTRVGPFRILLWHRGVTLEAAH